MAIKRHEQMTDELIGLMTLVARDNLDDLFRIELKKHLPHGYGFFKLTHQYLKNILKDPKLEEIMMVNCV